MIPMAKQRSSLNAKVMPFASISRLQRTPRMEFASGWKPTCVFLQGKIKGSMFYTETLRHLNDFIHDRL